MHDLLISHINCRSLTNEFQLFRDTVLLSHYDIVGLTETWLNEDIITDVLSIPHYSFIRRDRPSRGGGVGMYVHNSIKFEIIDAPFNDDIEQLYIKFRLNTKVFIFGVVYRKPSSKYTIFIENLENSVVSLLPICDVFICAGDFNINVLSFENSLADSFLEFIEIYGLHQIIREPTRLTDTSISLLDLILINDKDIVKDTQAAAIHGFSDHCLVSCKIAVSVSRFDAFPKTYRDFKYFNYDRFNADLVNAPFCLIFDADDIDSKVSIFNEVFHALLDQHAPRKMCMIKGPRKPWVTDTIKLMQKLRDKAFSKFKSTRNADHFAYYKELRNLTTSAIKREKKAYLDHCVSTASSKSLWSRLRDLHVVPTRNNSVLPPNLSNVDELNTFFVSFSSAALDLDPHIFNFYHHARRDISNENYGFFFHPVSEDDVIQVISKMTSKSVGCDGISVENIKLCCPQVLPFLSHIFNACIDASYFPSVWKKSRIVPLPKRNQPETLADLRPINILCAVSKVFEKLLEGQIRRYVDSIQALPARQSGFRPKYSCASALAAVCDDIFYATDQGKITCLILLDFSRAFDTVNHKILLLILESIGFTCDALSLIKDYLSYRSQEVELSGKTSNSLLVGSGVPQGSVLGPLLYTLYTSKLQDCLEHCSYHCYADDTQIYLSFDRSEIVTANNRINSDLARLVKFAEQHCLNINANKSTVMVFGRRSDIEFASSKLSILVNNKRLPIDKVARNLGLQMDSHLRFKNHISQCIRKSYSNLKQLYTHRKFLSVSNRRLLCDSLVLSHFNHCDVVYGPCLDAATSQRIQKVQNASIKFIYGLRKFQHVSHKLGDLGWLNMKNRRQLHLFVFFFNILTEKSPPYLYLRLTFRSDVHNINIRCPHLITPPFHRTAMFERSFSFNIARFYNGLPRSLSGLTLYSFKRLARDMILSSTS